MPYMTFDKDFFKRITNKICINILRYEKTIILQRNLTPAKFQQETKIKINCEIVNQNNFAKSAEKFKKAGIDSKKMFKFGDVCIIAEANGKIVHWTWVAFEENYVTEMGKKIKILRKDVAYLYAVYTLKDYRGLGIAPKAIEELLSHLYLKEIKKVFALVFINNHSSLKCFHKVGFKKVGLIKYMKLFRIVEICKCTGLKKCIQLFGKKAFTEEWQIQLAYNDIPFKIKKR